MDGITAALFMAVAVSPWVYIALQAAQMRRSDMLSRDLMDKLSRLASISVTQSSRRTAGEAVAITKSLLEEQQDHVEQREPKKPPFSIRTKDETTGRVEEWDLLFGDWDGPPSESEQKD
jgi:hypothetical protein